MTVEERIDLIKSVAAHGGEVIGADELPALLNSGEKLYTYDGFEPSGQMHIAQGIIRAINTNKMIDAGFTFRMWVADWFGYLNNKMGGDLEKIKTVGKYFVEIWKASGMNLEGTEFLWTSDFVGQRWYWELVMKIAKNSTLKRIIRTTQIMGRSESDDLSAGMIFYPCMQVADIFGVMHAQVTQLGLDQQKVNVLAREIGPEIGFWKPIIVSQGMLQGLQKPGEKKETRLEIERLKVGEVFYRGSKVDLKLDNIDEDRKVATVSFVDASGTSLRTAEFIESEKTKYFDMDITLLPDHTITVLENTPERMISMKMSKSQPDTAIFMTDSAEDVKRKIIKAYCPEGVIEENPILDYCKQIIFEAQYLKREKPLLENGVFVVKRPEKFGGDVSFNSYAELEQNYAEKKLFPLDLKNAVIEYLNELLEPVRKHFAENAEARELLEKVTTYQTTR